MLNTLMIIETNPVDEKWHSLRSLLEEYSPSLLASAIEKNGIWVIDRYNRKVKASVGATDNYSQSKALDLVADWAAELSDPSPTYSWNHERFELEPHPTQRFGWLGTTLPSFTDLSVSTFSHKKRPSQKQEWIALARAEAEAVLKRERTKGLNPKQDYVAKAVAKALADRGITTNRGAISAANVNREALSGEFWGKTRLKPEIN